MTDSSAPTIGPSHWLCRCEEVTADDVRAAIAAGARGPNDVKRRTRAGMGSCQGVYCLPAVAALLRSETGLPPDRVPPMTARPPVRPIGLDLLAAADE